jgi:lipid-binding SYLF domain-containing protein
LPRLNEDVDRFTGLVEKLLAKEEALEEAAPPSLNLVRCRGLVFTTVFKAGVGVGIERGHGFVIRRVAHPGGSAPTEEARMVWSAPLFLTVSAGSIGATLGWSTIDSVSLTTDAF